ncbi:dihydropyridine-sensitive L-type skeletal muscle calcium channel subunit alpha-1-like [Solea senegalensis]|uniref:Dihydropyridine-sensitive L-type skeletal muscle calcium channel subunit alpha-1-like n=1 Tax=Solea senegalensis TaxID=28829 RepID=A0AAV6SUK5_SOLSE|nr:dihydropyridine-sensitive L-type skeletal muscle calcium channel subunit alpha-1-like [Solea senegalensis]
MGGLGSMARDEAFVSATKQEMAEAMRIPVNEMEGLARGILKERSDSIPSVKKRRPIPAPPPDPPVPAQETGSQMQPDPAVRRKRRPIPMVPAAHKVEDTDSKV